MALDQAQSEYYTLDDALWERLIALTDGAAALCYQCGVCTATCPWGIVRDEPLSVRTLMRQAQLGLRGVNDSLWLCTTCAQCEAYCPRGVQITDVFRGLRAIAWEERCVEDGMPAMLWSLYWNDNPWFQPPSQRADWAKNLEIQMFDPTQHEILLYVGCTSSFDKRAQKITQSLVAVLNAAGVAFGYLGEAEPCCGEAALSVGHKPYFNEIAEKTIGIFREKGVTDLVTISPHCYDVFKNHYPLDSINPIHYTQYLADLIQVNRLKFTENNKQSLSTESDGFARKVTFQDPCYLGRHNGEFDAPRRVLQAIPGVELVEMADHGVDGLCCGGGGGRMWLETAPGERFSDLRVANALETGAELLATACPFCVVCLEDSAKLADAGGIQVMDIAEIAEIAVLG